MFIECKLQELEMTVCGQSTTKRTVSSSSAVYTTKVVRRFCVRIIKKWTLFFASRNASLFVNPHSPIPFTSSRAKKQRLMIVTGLFIHHSEQWDELHSGDRSAASWVIQSHETTLNNLGMVLNSADCTFVNFSNFRWFIFSPVLIGTTFVTNGGLQYRRTS